MPSTDIFAARRQALITKLAPNSMALIASGGEHVRNRDVEFPFRADSDFWYLTGFTEPEAVLVLIRDETLIAHACYTSEPSESSEQVTQSQGSNHQAWLFLRPKDLEKETWQGRRLGVDAAPKTLALDQAFEIDALDETLLPLLGHCQTLYFSFAQLADWGLRVADWISELAPQSRKGINPPTGLADLDGLLHEQRVIKSAEEIAWMRQAAQISVQGHLAAMRVCEPGGFEYQIQAAVEHAFRQQGSPRVAFNTIVASGENACILHYTENNACLKDGDLVLIDAGAEWMGYAGDISHTFPVNGRFSSAQHQLYSLVLKAQKAAIDQVKPGNSFDQINHAALSVLTEGLLTLGLLQGDYADLLDKQAVKRFFMHGTGHWLGMDVHDVGRYKVDGQWRDFVPGMVVTIEPGVYIPADALDVAAQWRGIGIRIEDDVLVTEQGCEVLTHGLPRTPEEIEQWMKQTQMC